MPSIVQKKFSKKNEVNFDFKPKTNEENMSITYGCFRFIDGFRLLSSSLESIATTLTDNKHKTFKSLRKEAIGADIMLNTVNELEILMSEDGTIEDLRKDLA